MPIDIEVKSPCIGVCVIDDMTNLCQGCYRTLVEIEQWWDLDANQKQAVIDQLSAREAQLFD